MIFSYWTTIDENTPRYKVDYEKIYNIVINNFDNIYDNYFYDVENAEYSCCVMVNPFFDEGYWDDPFELNKEFYQMEVSFQNPTYGSIFGGIFLDDYPDIHIAHDYVMPCYSRIFVYIVADTTGAGRDIFERYLLDI